MGAGVGEIGEDAMPFDRLRDGGVQRNIAETFRIMRLDDIVVRAQMHGLDDDVRLLAAGQPCPAAASSTTRYEANPDRQ